MSPNVKIIVARGASNEDLKNNRANFNSRHVAFILNPKRVKAETFDLMSEGITLPDLGGTTHFQIQLSKSASIKANSKGKQIGLTATDIRTIVRAYIDKIATVERYITVSQMSAHAVWVSIHRRRV